MAAFTTLALLALAGAAGGYGAKKALSKQGTQKTPSNILSGGDATGSHQGSILAPAPTGTAVPRGTATTDAKSTTANPPDATRAASTAAGQAALAAQKTRRKAAGGASTPTPSSVATAQASLQPRTLLGY